MVCVFRTTTFLAAFLCAVTAFSQVPPGVPYNPAKHPNPIVTYIQTKDFRKTTYADAKKVSGFDPLGLSEKEGERQSIEIAEPKPTTQKIALPNDEFPLIKVEYFPVVRQTYILKTGVALVVDAFKFPKVPIPMNDLTQTLNDAAFRPGDKFWKSRWGPYTIPERIDVRGVAALLFDDNHELVLFWRDGTECYVVKTKASRTDLFRIVADLL